MPEKRKRPPTFQHFPANRAQKLKQSWVQKAKLKSKWKAEKRKMAPVVPEEVQDNDQEEEAASETSQRSPTPPPAKRARTTQQAPTSPPTKRVRKPQPEPAPAESSNAPTLRDRAREAYSRASLHTYRSDPLGKKQRGGKPGTTGRGQPDMKRRMNVLLDTIKRDFA